MMKIERWGYNPGLSRWAKSHHKGPYRREAEGSESERDTERDQKMLLVLKMKEETMNQAGKSKEWILP